MRFFDRLPKKPFSILPLLMHIVTFFRSGATVGLAAAVLALTGCNSPSSDAPTTPPHASSTNTTPTASRPADKSKDPFGAGVERIGSQTSSNPAAANPPGSAASGTATKPDG